VRWYYEEACSSSFLLIGVILRGGPNMTLDVWSLACGDRDVCEKGGELIRPNYTLENFAVLEENINSLVLTHALGVSVFPARSGFTPGWVPNSQGELCSMQVVDVLFGCLFSCFLIIYAAVDNIDHP